MKYHITLDPSRIDIEQIHPLLAGAYWSLDVRRDVVERAFRNSIAAVAIDEQNGAIVGVARVVTDQATFAWLCDVFVHPDHRGRGLSTRMISELHADPRLTTLRRWCLATRDAHDLYRRFGYTPVASDRWMERKMPESAWRAS